MKVIMKTFTKKLAITVLRVWVAVVIFSCVAKCFSIDAESILLSVSGTLSIVLSGYFTKSFLENKEKFSEENIDKEMGC